MRRTQTGLTLIELMVTMAVAITLLGVGVPLFNSMVDSNRATSQANAVASALYLARSEAVKTGNRVSICPKEDPSPANLACGDSADWANGWMVYRGGAVATVAAGNLVRIWPAPGGMTIATTVDGLTYTNTGELEGGGPLEITLSVTGCAAGSSLRRVITITPVGQVQTEREACS
jgi:type IV fimbrial biogenesis protein FimT